MSESINGLKRTKMCGMFDETDIGNEVVAMGWVQKSRNKGSLIFVDLRDRTGIVQLVFDEKICDNKLFEKEKELKFEYCIAIKGVVNKRQDINEKIFIGYIEIYPNELRILSTCDVLPFPIENEINTREELRLEYRYLDLRRVPLKNNIILRSKLTNSIRKFLASNDFLEIETPTLCKSTPEGARDYLVPSRVNVDSFYALPQSPQLYKQLLMVSGMDRYFQIARCYKDEDLRADRQPEFTQVYMELSFVDIDDVIEINEKLLKFVFKDALNMDLNIPFKRLKWIVAMNQYGSDKPDIRFDMRFIDVTSIFVNTGFSVFKNVIDNGGIIKCLNVKNSHNMSRKKLDGYIEFVKEFGLKGLSYIIIDENSELKSTFTKFLNEYEIKNVLNTTNAKNGDLLLFAADKKEVVWKALGELRLKLARDLNLIDDDKYEFLWVTEFALFEFSEEENRLVAMHHPFTMVMDEDIDLFFNNPKDSRAKAYDIVLNGYEIGDGIRIHQSNIQQQMFKILGFTEDKANEQFGFLLNAFKYGVPPHGGLAYGLDRIAMLMAKANSIRDIIAFPKTKDATCLMVKAPSNVDEKQLKELHIKIDNENE